MLLLVLWACFGGSLSLKTHCTLHLTGPHVVELVIRNLGCSLRELRHRVYDALDGLLGCLEHLGHLSCQSADGNSKAGGATHGQKRGWNELLTARRRHCGLGWISDGNLVKGSFVAYCASPALAQGRVVPVAQSVRDHVHLHADGLPHGQPCLGRCAPGGLGKWSD